MRCITYLSETISPSMDIQIASNFERLIFDLNNEDDKQTKLDMKNQIRCKSVLNSSLKTMKFHNCHHFTSRSTAVSVRHFS